MSRVFDPPDCQASHCKKKDEYGNASVLFVARAVTGYRIGTPAVPGKVLRFLMALTHEQHVRRVAILCCHTLRNLALYRAYHYHPTGVKLGQFWSAVNGNFLDSTVLEWCKLFGDPKGKHFYATVVDDPTIFATDMYAHLGRTPDEFEAMRKEMRKLRDKFIAHLDEDLVMDIPVMDTAKGSVSFLYDRLRAQEAGKVNFNDAPPSADEYYNAWLTEGHKQYAA